MTNKALTEIVLVVDRSGSMQSCRVEAENGINQFIKEQKEVGGQANFTLVQFDNRYDFVHEGVAMDSVPDFKLEPRGMTALLDATGRAIAETGSRLSRLKEKNRPGLVVFVIVTDGLENSSHEYNLQQVKGMIEEQKNKYSWQFTFLGAGPEAFAGGVSMGFDIAGMGDYDINETAVAYAASSANVTRMRCASASGYTVDNSFTDAELKSMKSS